MNNQYIYISIDCLILKQNRVFLFRACEDCKRVRRCNVATKL